MALDDYRMALSAQRADSNSMVALAPVPVIKPGARTERPTEIWNVEWKDLSIAEYQALRDEYLAAGTHTPLAITMPGELSTRKFAFMNFQFVANSAASIHVKAAMLYVPGV